MTTQCPHDGFHRTDADLSHCLRVRLEKTDAVLRDAIPLIREVIESPFITDETVWQAWVLKWRPRADAVIAEASR